MESAKIEEQKLSNSTVELLENVETSHIAPLLGPYQHFFNQSFMDSSKTEDETPSKHNGEYLDLRGIPIPYGHNVVAQAGIGFSAIELGMPTLELIMEALKDPNIYMMGVCKKENNHMAYLLERVIRRARRDNLFGVIVEVCIGKKPNLRRIQDEIAREIGFSFQGQEKEEKSAFCFLRTINKKAATENAQQLSDKIRTEPKILFILHDLWTRLDLANLGIPFGEDHKGCKLILTSESEELLSNQMNTQRTFKI